MEHCGTQRLETDRLVLRRFTREDATAMFKNWASDPKVTKFLMWPTHTSVDTSKMVADAWVNSYAKDNYYQWAITLKQNGDEPIGCIGVTDLNDKLSSVHIGYCIGSKWWHMGVTSEAFQIIINFLFDVVKVNRIESRHDPKNPNSGLVMKKCGLKYEGTLRSADWNNTGICDASYYAILRSDR